MSPKERVRANIYKQLLENEKKKNSRHSKISLSIMFIGIIGLAGYQKIINGDLKDKKMVFNSSRNMAGVDKIEIDQFFTNEIFNAKKVEVDTRNLFDIGFQS